jgi:hypothetical protein
MSNGHVCCLTTVCCPPGSPEQEAAFARWMVKHMGVSEAVAQKGAAELLAEVAVVPKAMGAALWEHAQQVRAHGTHSET